MKYVSLELTPEERRAYDAAAKRAKERTLVGLLLTNGAVALYLDAAFYWTEGMLMLAVLASFGVLAAIIWASEAVGNWAGDRAVDRMRCQP